jgi:hypothetical protein
MRKYLIVLALIVLGTTAGGVSAQAPEAVRLEAAQTLVREKDGLLTPVALFGLTADLFCRSYFAEVRRDAGWGPNHPNWGKWLPDFCQELVQISLPEGHSLEAFLVLELAKGLTEAELVLLHDRNSDPVVAAASSRLQRTGLNWAFVVQAERPPGTAGLYSSAERETARMTAQILRREVPSAEPDLRVVALYVGDPAFEKYQRILGQAFMNSAGRLDSIPQGKFARFMRVWHAKVSEPAR